DPPLPLALQDLQLLLVRERTLELLLGRAQAGDDQAERVAPVGVARERRLLEVVLHARDEAHPGTPCRRPPRTCQCRWKIVCPPPSPTLAPTRLSSGPASRAVSRTKSSIFFTSSGENSQISRNVGTCRSGMTSRCVSARGLMSRTATKPSPLRTWSPSR